MFKNDIGDLIRVFNVIGALRLEAQCLAHVLDRVADIIEFSMIFRVHPHHDERSVWNVSGQHG